MIKEYDLNVKIRTKAGKGAARAVRRSGGVPAVLYGNKETPSLLEVSPRELFILINHLGLGMYNHVVKLDDGESVKRALIRDVQFDVVKDLPIHVDFLRVSKTTKVHVHVPVVFLNQDKSSAIKRGAVLNVVRAEVEVLCLVDDIPEHIVFDIEKAKFGETLRISGANLSDNIEPVTRDGEDFVVATIVAPRGGVKGGDDEDETSEE